MLNKKALSAAFGVEKDADFKQTVLLLHGDGTNGAQNNTFTDSSTNAFTITRNGNTTQGTFSPFSVADGEWSNYFDGTGDYLAFANGTFYLSNNNFVVEAFVYLPNAISGSNGTIAAGNTDAATAAGSSWDMTINTSQKLASTVWIGSTNYTITSSASVSTGQWVHLAFVRTGGTISQFINGTKDGTNTTLSTNSVQNGSNTYPPHVGRNGGGADFPGYISNFRLIVGSNASSVYDATGSSITAPTAPLTAVTDTKVLTCRSNRFVDISSSPNTVTPNGNTSVQPFSPFAPSAAYSASTNGGSGYFDENGDYLDCGNGGTDYEFGSGDFTIEGWFYCLGKSLRHQMIMAKGSPTTNNAYDWRLYWGDTSNQRIWFDSNVFSVSSDATTTEDLVLNAWNHIAVVRSGANGYLYLNGTRIDSVAASGTMNNSYTNVYVGAGNVGSASQTYYNGYANGIRLLKGTAQYTGSTYTVPTSPFTAITNTELLLNFTNAAIFDQTGKNNLETVGNAQIDTTTKKYGTGSMEFDGTGDWLLMPNTPDQQLGTGNFTIEFWVYLASGDTGSNRGLVAKGTSTTGFLVSLNTTEKVVFTYATSTITSSGAITTNAWNHIAVVREGTGSNQTKIYIGGTNDGTGTVSTDFNQTSVMYVGANRTGGDPMKGFIDDLRVTKGVARYTANFTPPAKAFADQ